MTFDDRASYRIQVHGLIAAHWSDRLEGMAVSAIMLEDGGCITSLEGELADQAALAGVLNTLYELRLPMLSVECLTARLHEETK